MKISYTKIYGKSPRWLQNFIISAYGLKIYRQRYGKTYWEKRKEFENTNYGNFEIARKGQIENVTAFLKFAKSESPYYKNSLRDIVIEDIKTVEDLRRLPIMEKEEFRSNVEHIYTIENDNAISSFTGGTTGKAIKVLFTKEDFQTRMAYLDTFKVKLGIDPFKSRKATFSGRQITNSSTHRVFWRNNWFYNQRLYSTFDLSDDTIPLYIKDLNDYKPQVINGFVSAIYEVAKYIESRNIKLEFVPDAIFTTSETLLSFHRQVIERVFQSKIYNQYASAEGAPFITECINGNLHYNLDTGVIESYPTEYGNEILVTSFTTHGTPLIRYRIGDKVKFMEGICECGSVHPLVEAIEGRQVEFLYAMGGRKVSLSHLADVIKGLPNSIKQMQFVQKTLRNIEVHIVPDKNMYTTEDEVSIISEMKYRFGDTTQIDLIYTDEIEREKSGKYALIKNLKRNKS